LLVAVRCPELRRLPVCVDDRAEAKEAASKPPCLALARIDSALLFVVA
jgi:hypothetical protein